MIHRIELLGKLKTGVITLSGGEPLLHPELDEIIKSIRHNATLAGMITNGYLLTADRIRKLNELDWTTCRSASITSCLTTSLRKA